MVKSQSFDSLVLVLTTEANRTNADYLAIEILNSRLAACVSLREINSHFWWKGKLEQANEIQLLIKTSQNNLQSLLKVIKKLHSYETPELIYWSAAATDGYGLWMEEVLYCSD